MLKTFVLDKHGKSLMPCHPARARKLLDLGKAKVFKMYPFTIILTEREGGDTQPVEQKIDPGSKTTGMALVADGKRGKRVVFALHLSHRGQKIKESLDSRRAIRRGRRFRTCRYRKPRFDNRSKPQGWLPPSLRSRVDNVVTWSEKILRLCPYQMIAVETVRFDTQKLENPEISGIEYQQGELFGYEVKEYLLEKWGRSCAYCDKKNVPLEVEHIVPKSRGGSNRISNLTLACSACNLKKGASAVEEFVSDKERLKRIKGKAQAPLRDAAAVNATRLAIVSELKKLGLPTSLWSGGQTKFNRRAQGYTKDHWVDAACVGESGANVYLDPRASVLCVTAEGRGTRQMCRVDRYGFPRTAAKSAKRISGFQTGDIVKAVVPIGKKAGTYIGKVAIRSSGFFNIKTNIISGDKSTTQGISAKYCKIQQRQDGYSYAILGSTNTEKTSVPTHPSRFSPKGFSFPPSPEGEGFQEKL